MLKMKDKILLKKEDLVICCYEEDYWWIDENNHEICLILDIPEERILEHGFGIYEASVNFGKTHIWSGRRGSVIYKKVPECYIKSYSINDVIAMSLPNWTESSLLPIKNTCKDCNIQIFKRPDLLEKERQFKENLKITFCTSLLSPKLSIHNDIKEYIKNWCHERQYNGEAKINCYNPASIDEKYPNKCSAEAWLINKTGERKYTKFVFHFNKTDENVFTIDKVDFVKNNYY